jgi:DNA-directed RNA polymerase subunit alpha
MSTISLPQKVEFEKGKKNTGTVSISGCYPGYGTTVGNALRRVLLSSLEGAAITAVKIKGVAHEFSAIDGVEEDAVQIVLNLKSLRLASHSDEPVKIQVSKSGEGVVTAGDISKNADIDISDKDHVICTLTDKKASIEMELTVERGVGYIPVDQQVRDDIELGSIAIDAVYTPIRRVNFTVENMRVGKRTDYEKVTLEIETDGSIDAMTAFKTAVDILNNQFGALKQES